MKIYAMGLTEDKLIDNFCKIVGYDYNYIKNSSVVKEYDINKINKNIKFYFSGNIELPNARIDFTGMKIDKWYIIDCYIGS